MPYQEEARERPRTRCRDYVFVLTWEHLGIPPEEQEVSRETTSLLRLCSKKETKVCMNYRGARFASFGQILVKVHSLHNA